MVEIKIIDSDSLPRCPHCEKELDTIAKIRHGAVEKHTIYICPHCKKVIGVGHNEWT